MRSTTLIVLGMALSAAPVVAQQTCGLGTTEVNQSCNAMVKAAEVLQARTGIALTGGNPVPGASSTLGMRIGSVPRVSIALRATGVGLDMPSVQLNGSDHFTGLLHSIDVDAGVGLFSGVVLAPTIGGFGSVDILGSVGSTSLPTGNGVSGQGGSWALGARLGILRESFTAPGISVTGMYRHIGDMSGAGGPSPAGTSRQFALKNNSALSVRGVIGKRLFVVGANVGVGYDSFKSDVSASAAGLIPVPQTATFTHNGQKNGHMTAFANATWTMLILNFVAEGGYQKDPNKNGYYGSLAVRLAL